MKQINSSFLGCLNLAVTDKFQNHLFHVLIFLPVMKMFVPPVSNNNNYGNSKKRERKWAHQINTNPVNNRHATKHLPGTYMN